MQIRLADDVASPSFAREAPAFRHGEEVKNVGPAVLSSIIPFDFNQHTVRVVIGSDGEPWFVSSDVCTALNIGNSRDVLARLDDDERGVGSIDTPGGKQDMTLINEPGLYSLVLGSRKPEAKRFKRWVTHAVLASIRRTGAYRIHQEETRHGVSELINANTLFRSNFDTAQILFRGNQAILSANKATRRATGVDVPANLEATHLMRGKAHGGANQTDPGDEL